MPHNAQILFVITNYPPRPGGAERHTQRLCASLAERRNRIRVLTIRHSGYEPDRESERAPVWYFPTPPSTHLRDALFALWVAGVLPLLRPRYKQVQWVMTGLQLVLGLPISATLGMKNIVMLAGCGEGERLRHWVLGRWVLRMMKHHADRIIILNSAMKKEMESLGFEPDCLVLLGCEADPDKFWPPEKAEKALLRTQWGIAQDSTVIVFAGRLVPGKGLPALLHAFVTLLSRHPTLVLVIAGGGVLLPELHANVEQRGLGASVLFTGQLDDLGVSKVLRCADIFALPSESEGIPAALVEALASGLPSVVSDIPGTEIVVEGIHGLRFESGNLAALTASLESLIVNLNLRNRMGHAAHELYLSSFTPEKVARAHELMYQSILKKGAAGGEVESAPQQ